MVCPSGPALPTPRMLSPQTLYRMPTSLRARLSALGMVGLSMFITWTPALYSQSQDQQIDEGYAITHSTTVEA